MVWIKMTLIQCRQRLFVLLLLPLLAFGFVPKNNYFIRQPSYSTTLHGLSEWRDDQGFSETKKHESPTTRSLHLLPFPATEALLPGQTTKTVLKQGRYFDMLDDVTEHCHSMLGMLLMGDDGLLNHMPLCEVVDWEVKSGFRGRVNAEVTLRAVSRAQLVEIQQMKPLIMGDCQEMRLDHDVPTNKRRPKNIQKRQESMLLAEELVQGVEKMLHDCDSGHDRLQTYNTAYAQSLQAILQNDPRKTAGNDDVGRNSTSISTGTDDDPTKGVRSLCELSAASWAMFACLKDDNRKVLGEAFACDNVVERLQLVRKALLEETFLTMDDQVYGGVQDDEDLNVIGFE